MSGGGREEEKRKKKKREMIILKSESKPDERKKIIIIMMIKNMVQIHDEQRSIQMTILHRDIHKNTAQTSTVITNNGSKNSKCKPESDTQ